MYFITGELMLVFGVFYFCFALLAVRNPNRGKWNKSWMTENVHLFFTLGAFVLGPSFMIKGITLMDNAGTIGLHAIGFAALLAATMIGVKQMHVKKRLAEYEAVGKGGNVVGITPEPPSDGDKKGQTPYRKAA